MKIGGFQKLTLLDFPEKTACTVFTAGCNLRCPFCHNAGLVTRPNEDEYSEDEILAFLKGRKGKLDGVCITGGEPLLQKDIEEFISKIKAEGYLVKLDTNGCFPEKLKSLISKGLVDYVAMDIKNSFDRYGETVGIENFDTAPIKESIKILTESGIPFEFRTTVVKEFHNNQSFEEIGNRIDENVNYFLQKFKDSGDLIGENLSSPTEEEMQNYLKTLQKYILKAQMRG